MCLKHSALGTPLLLCRAIHGGKTTLKVVHRVALFDSHSRITHIVSQSDIAR